jgi:hypothetical protein
MPACRRDQQLVVHEEQENFQERRRVDEISSSSCIAGGSPQRCTGQRTYFARSLA